MPENTENQDKPVKIARKRTSPAKATTPTVSVEPVQNVPTLAELAISAHNAAMAAMATETDKPGKVRIPRRKDIVVVLDEDGTIYQTGVITRAPSSFTLIRWDGENRVVPTNTDKLSHVGQNVWKLG